MRSKPVRHATRPHGWAIVLVLTFALCVVPVIDAQEPSPIEVQLAAPGGVPAGSVFEVSIAYDAIDLNAGADLNYNVFGPCRIVERDPEPPDPIVNTWVPRQGTAQGTIRLRIQVEGGSEGQVIHHQVEVRWGTKVRVTQAVTEIRPVPPTPTPTPTALPAAPLPPSQPTPSPSPTSTAQPISSARLVRIAFVAEDKTPSTDATANQEIRLRVEYTSTVELKDVGLRLWFDPDVVNLYGARPEGDGGYTIELSTLAADSEGADAIAFELEGRIRPHDNAGATYDLQAQAELVVPAHVELLSPRVQSSESISVAQPLMVDIQATTDVDVVRVGGSFIVHATCVNRGDVPVRNLVLRLEGLPAMFSVTPLEQAIDVLPAQAGVERRLFAVRTPAGIETEAGFKLVALLDEVVIESRPLRIVASAPLPLQLEVTVHPTTLYAGETARVNARITNPGRLPVQGVTARVIDTAGNLGVVIQDVGDIPPRASRELIFAIAVPPEFLLDAVSLLVVETISADGTTSRSEPQQVSVACVPRLAISAQAPAGQLAGGQSVQVIVVLRNESPCVAREARVSLEGLPPDFVPPPEQRVVELAPGSARHLTFNVLIPQGYQGSAAFTARATCSAHAEAASAPLTLVVRGVPAAFAVVFGVLVLAAVGAIMTGIALYFRNR